MIIQMAQLHDKAEEKVVKSGGCRQYLLHTEKAIIAKSISHSSNRKWLLATNESNKPDRKAKQKQKANKKASENETYYN